MRILAIDAGNSRIKWGVHEDGSCGAGLGRHRAAGATRARVDRLDPPEVVVATNVAGERIARSIAGTARRLGRRARFVKSAASQCGVRNSYDRPAQLGADRWAALIGARHLHRGPA